MALPAAYQTAENTLFNLNRGYVDLLAPTISNTCDRLPPIFVSTVDGPDLRFPIYVGVRIVRCGSEQLCDLIK